MYRSDENCPVVLQNVEKTRRVWNRLGKLLRRERENPRVYGMFYREVVQTVLLFGTET